MAISSSACRRRDFYCVSSMWTMKIHIVARIAVSMVMMVASSSSSIRFAAGFTVTTTNYHYKPPLPGDRTLSTNVRSLLPIRLSSLSLMPMSSSSYQSRLGTQTSTTSTTTTTTATALKALPDNYQEYGEEMIRLAASKSCGIAVEDLDSLNIEWKPGKIIVTVFSDETYVSVDTDDDDDDHDDGEDLDNSDDNDIEDSNSSQASRGVDVTALARAINEALDDSDGEGGGGLGFAIAEVHEIEVTTPGAPDELTGIMWDSYRGFEVICQFMDPKTKKTKTIEGRLHERNDEFTVINIKGRMKKLKNDSVVSVKLPKAKKEKGVS